MFRLESFKTYWGAGLLESLAAEASLGVPKAARVCAAPLV